MKEWGYQLRLGDMLSLVEPNKLTKSELSLVLGTFGVIAYTLTVCLAWLHITVCWIYHTRHSIDCAVLSNLLELQKIRTSSVNSSKLTRCDTTTYVPWKDGRRTDTCRKIAPDPSAFFVSRNVGTFPSPSIKNKGMVLFLLPSINWSRWNQVLDFLLAWAAQKLNVQLTVHRNHNGLWHISLTTCLICKAQ